MENRHVSEMYHRYGPRVHLHSDPYVLSLLARIGSPEVHAPAVLNLIRSTYRSILGRALACSMPTAEIQSDTRMNSVTPLGVWSGRAFDPATRVVIANVMRAGNVPSLVCYEELTALLDPSQVRIDHFYFSRVSDEDGKVVGVESAGSKVGGAIHDSVLILPDPMGATGRTTVETVEAYRERDLGTPKLILALHLIITPEYVRRVLEEAPEVIVHAGRIDRGTSPKDVLQSVPGARIEEERGLNDVGYIVPGAGGLGEVINNAWV